MSNDDALVDVEAKLNLLIDVLNDGRLDTATEDDYRRFIEDLERWTECYEVGDVSPQMMDELNRTVALFSRNDESDRRVQSTSKDEDLLIAAAFGDATTVGSLIAEGANVDHQNDEGRTSLVLALGGLCRKGLTQHEQSAYEQVVDCLLRAGADPNLGFMHPLILAVMTRRLQLVGALIRVGAAVSEISELPTDDDDGTMPGNALFVALMPDEDGTYMDEGFALTLIDAGADLWCANEDGTMAIHLASAAGMALAIEKMLDRVPGLIDVQDGEGSTPLMLAAASGQVEAIKALTSRGANRNLRNTRGRTATQIATEAGHLQAAAILS